ncbi:iron-containing alcohol dehydrogenase [Peribacillus simplex]
MNFQFLLTTKVIMKKGIRLETGKYLKENSLQHVLIITDKGIKNAGLLEDVYTSLKKNNVTFDEFYEVKPNPRDTDCDSAANQFRDKKIDGILTIGGGSAIDTAKAVSILLTNGGTIKDYEGISVATNEPLPIICIPTTAGTGSEVTFWSIITDTKNEYKMAIGDSRIAPKIALLDTELTASLPASIAASTGMDALTHAIEAYTCKVANPITDGMALHAIRLISENLVEAIYGNNNENARQNMLIGSLIAGIAFGNSDTASVHCLSEAIGGLYDTPHGVANAIFLPYVFKHNMDADIKKHAEVGYAMGIDPRLPYAKASQESVKMLFKLSERLNIPKFSEINHVNPKDFLQLAKKSLNNFSNPDNVKEMSVKDYLEILEGAYTGIEEELPIN